MKYKEEFVAVKKIIVIIVVIIFLIILMAFLTGVVLGYRQQMGQ